MLTIEIRDDRSITREESVASLGQLLCDNTDELVQRWYMRWQAEGPARPDLSVAVLKDHLPVQLRVIGEALLGDEEAKASPRELWQTSGRLDPEQRVRDDIPIEEVVREYAFVVEEVRIWLHEIRNPVDVDDFSFFSVAIFELAAESARRYSDFQAERVQRERSQYLAGLAHQLRNPITTLRLVVQRLDRGDAVLDTRMLERLRRTVGRLGRLTDGVLRLERFLPDELPVRPELLSPAQMIDQLIGDYEYTAHQKGLRLDVSSNRSLRMEADADLLTDALGNLIENAIKYTEKGFVRVTLDEENGWIVFRIEDSGPGIGEERRKALFQPVQPGKPGGVGLGLTIAHRAAVAQGGSIEVQSEEGKGSTFVLRLPRRVQARRQAEEGAGGS